MVGCPSVLIKTNLKNSLFTFYCCMTHRDKKETQVGKDLFQLPTFRSVSSGESQQDLKAETEAQAMDECYLLSYSLWFAQPNFLQHPTPTEVAPSVVWALPQQSIRKMPYISAHSQSAGGFSQLRFVFLDNSSSCQVHRKINQGCEETVYLAYISRSQSITEKSLKQKPQRHDVYWFAHRLTSSYHS